MEKFKSFAKEHVEFVVLILTILGISFSINSRVDSLQQENKDFHGRLCSLEEKHNKNMEEIFRKALEEGRLKER